MKNKIPKCKICGKKMKQVKDPLTKKFTGHLWKCSKCMPKGTVISLG